MATTKKVRAKPKVTRQCLEWLTTGQVAKACGVAPRTVSKWTDAGLLPVTRVPGSLNLDRRIRATDFVVFALANGFSLTPTIRGWLGKPSIATVGLSAVERDRLRALAPGLAIVTDSTTLPAFADSLTAAAVTLAVVVGTGEGAEFGREVIKLATRLRPTTPVYGVDSDDGSTVGAPDGVEAGPFHAIEGRVSTLVGGYYR